MNKTRIPMMIVFGSLVVVAVIAILTLQRTTGVQGSGLSKPVGMGDLRRLESQQAIPNTGADIVLKRSRSQTTGFGDLRRVESQQEIPNTGAADDQERSRSQVSGFGDLHRFESQQTISHAGTLEKSLPEVGMGDLHRFESTRYAEQQDSLDEPVTEVGEVQGIWVITTHPHYKQAYWLIWEDGTYKYSPNLDGSRPTESGKYWFESGLFYTSDDFCPKPGQYRMLKSERPTPVLKIVLVEDACATRVKILTGAPVAWLQPLSPAADTSSPLSP